LCLLSSAGGKIPYWRKKAQGKNASFDKLAQIKVKRLRTREFEGKQKNLQESRKKTFMNQGRLARQPEKRGGEAIIGGGIGWCGERKSIGYGYPTPEGRWSKRVHSPLRREKREENHGGWLDPSEERLGGRELAICDHGTGKESLYDLHFWERLEEGKAKIDAR